MQSRRDHLQAYQFATGRLASSLVSGDPGSGEAPMRRFGLGATYGVVITVLLVVAATVYGLLRPVENTAWAHNGALVFEKETGTRYLYLGGQLHPTANYASALLAVGSGVHLEQVSRASLAGVPRGVAVGIPGAPDDVAPPTALLNGGWADCMRRGTAVDEALDFDPSGVHRIPGDATVLVAGPGTTRYVLWNGKKYAVGSRSVLVALGLDTEQPVKATADWLAALPSGPAIAPPAIPGTGSKGTAVAGDPAVIGQVFRAVIRDTSHYYVLKADGLAPLSATEAALIAAGPGGHGPVRVSPADIAAVRASGDTTLMHRIPDLLDGKDATADGGAALCLLYSADGRTVTVVRETGGAATARASVIVPPDAAVLAAPPKDSAGGTTSDAYLITDQGVKHRLDGQAAEALGYGGVTPRSLPAGLLARIPSGVRLTRAQAVAPVPGVN
ncbi:type VII secretion protein EccB [Streptomyces sp. NPDC005573]|uniref:type VII secretion protein EccB n=1 Tax=Streptomyces sp. NPDC005573 TaxID=3156890 RepID=UPI0033B3F65B